MSVVRKINLLLLFLVFLQNSALHAKLFLSHHLFVPLVCDFDGIDNQGRAHVALKLAELQLGKVSLTLCALFSTKGDAFSPHVGKGWSLPFLESTATPMNEREYLVYLPDGEHIALREINDKKGYYTGRGVRGEWSAHHERDAFVVEYVGQNIRFTYREGKLVDMYHTQRQEHVMLKYDEEGRVTSISDGKGDTFYQVTSEKNHIQFRGKNDNLLEFVLTEVPVGGEGREVVSELGTILHKGEKIWGFQYSTGEKTNTLKITNLITNADRVIAWDPKNGCMQRDNDIVYTITPAKNEYANASIYRKRPYVQYPDKWLEESWSLDKEAGKETTLRSDGYWNERTWFTSGSLRGQMRRIAEKSSSMPNWEQTTEFFYDEQGRLQRKVVASVLEKAKKQEEIIYVYDESGQLGKSAVAVIMDRKKVYETTPGGKSLGETYLKQLNEKNDE